MKKPSKNFGAKNHSSVRANQRYRVKLSQSDFTAINSDIREGRFAYEERQTDGRSIIVMNIAKIGANVPIVYDRKSKVLITVLPREAVKRKLRKLDLRVTKIVVRQVAQIEDICTEPTVIDPNTLDTPTTQRFLQMAAKRIERGCPLFSGFDEDDNRVYTVDCLTSSARVRLNVAVDLDRQPFRILSVNKTPLPKHDG